MVNWKIEETGELKKLYKENNVPSDELVKDKEALENFTINLNKRINPQKNFSSKEIADKLFKLRKSGKLPRIRR
jgi:hypothetical protein